mmetsp:Transcript_592/g.998  ORF Transcript_592/g.998 Transcript_592/m.998 type:complete len:703 (-) Transcript_592:1530-3638(-)|eukprot:CAMPEP_0113605824 /NCGR_PEP_ID=MMETSP0017_2-20120614/2534_1 /TAXON_ID=2856 /ORGANISM="Cylindrotheca closterium" /LENGTH=702 /DNA_ID=CAMNT_0000514341 /DNA_START=107 /DNA_END=2215 /DNA_ORIENTATION=+ /assembly_acc=CAM_ASM_000147
MSNICDIEDFCGRRGRPPLNSKDEEVMVQSFFTPFGQSSRDDQSGRFSSSQRGDLEGGGPSSAKAGAHYPDNQELLDFDYPAVAQKVMIITEDAADVDPRPMSRKASSRFKPSPQRARSAPQPQKRFDVPLNIQYSTPAAAAAAHARSHAMHHNNNNNNQVPQRYRGGQHDEDSTIFGEDMKSANTMLDEASNFRTPPRIRNANKRPSPRSQQQQQQHRDHRIEYNDEEDSAMLGGLQFVSERGTVKPLFPITESSQQSQQSMYSYSVDSASHRSSPTPFEDLPLDEYNVTLASMDEYSKTSSPSRFGNVRHRLPSQKRASNFAVLETRRNRCLRGFGILTLILAISIGVFAYLEIIDEQQSITRTAGSSGSDPSQAGKSEGGPKGDTPVGPSVPNRPPEEVEELKASEAYSILGPKVENPALLLDPETAQGKAFDQIFLETSAERGDSGDGPGRFLDELAEVEALEEEEEDGRELQSEFREYRISQRFALMVLYFSTGGDESAWLNNLGWNIFERNECEWHGVECFNRNRVATNVTLSQNGLVGELPSELCLLKEVEYLVLDQNALLGDVPECIAKMKKLKDIDLHQNDFATALPNSFFLSDSLRTMDFSQNGFTGVIDVPSMDTEKKGFRSFGGFKTIKLNDNNLSGQIDDAFMFFTGLERLTLHNNNLVGGIDVMCVHPLREFTADCTKVTCTCCSACY